MQNESEKPVTGATLNERINEFVQKHRKPIFILTGLIMLSLIAFIASLSIADMMGGRSISAVEEFGSRYEALRPSITEEYSSVDVAELVAEIERFAAGKKGYAGGKAWSIIGNIHSDRKDWPAAEAAWVSAANAAKKTYMVPLAYFNAGVAAEEQGKAEAAIEFYSSSLAYSADFPAAPRAQFAIGRLRESLNDRAAAIEAYRAVISGWSYDRIWSSLARSRIVALEVE